MKQVSFSGMLYLETFISSLSPCHRSLFVTNLYLLLSNAKLTAHAVSESRSNATLADVWSVVCQASRLSDHTKNQLNRMEWCLILMSCACSLVCG